MGKLALYWQVSKLKTAFLFTGGIYTPRKRLSNILLKGLCMNKANLAKFLSTHLFPLICGVSLMVVTLLTGLVWHSYQNAHAQIDSSLKEAVTLVKHSVSAVFEQVDASAAFVATKISQDNVTSPEHLAKILYKGASSSEVYSFVTSDGYEIANSKIGVIRNPERKSPMRYGWMITNRTKPGILHHAKADIEVPSGERFLPLGVGVVGEAGAFLGSVTYKLPVRYITEAASKVMLNEGIDFVLLDRDMEVIAGSSSLLSQMHKHVFSGALKRLSYRTKEVLPLQNNMRVEDTEFRFSQGLYNYPYTVVVGMDKSQQNVLVWNNVAPKLLVLVVVMLSLAMLMYVLKCSIFEPLKSVLQFRNGAFATPSCNDNLKAFAAKIAGLTKDNQDLEAENAKLSQKIAALQHSDSLQSNFIHEIHSVLYHPLKAVIQSAKMARDECIDNPVFEKYFSIVFHAGKQLERKVPYSIKPARVDVADMVGKCIAIKDKDAIINKNPIEVVLDPDTPDMWTDRLRFCQMILGAMHYVWQRTPKGVSIKVSTRLLHMASKRGGFESLELNVENNGWHTSFPGCGNIWQVGEGPNESNCALDATKIPITLVEELVEAQQGIFSIKSEEGKFTKVTIHLPYMSEEELEYCNMKLREQQEADITGQKHECPDNVVQFPKKPKG